MLLMCSEYLSFKCSAVCVPAPKTDLIHLACDLSFQIFKNLCPTL